MSVGDEFGRRAADDKLCAEVERAVREDDADALRRLGLDGWGDYVQRLSELMSESVRDELDYSPDFGALMSQVASPARYAHHLVTESGTAVQKAKDTPLGIHIKPLEPEFDDDALKGTVGTAANAESPEQAVETLADGLAYAVKKAGNEFVEKNAEQRSRAGFEVGVKRSGSTKCCPWCAARIGSWALKNAPDGVFGCHANCSCVVEYTSSTGAVSQRRGTGRFVEVEYQPPHRMTAEEAAEKGGFSQPQRMGVNNSLPIDAAPISHTIEELQELADYAKSRGIRYYNPTQFDGDIELMKRHIDIIASLRDEFKIKKNLTIRTSPYMGEDLGMTSPNGRNISLNPLFLRSEEKTSAYLNADNVLSATNSTGISAHEMGHVIAKQYGEIGLDIARKAYYNIFGEDISELEMIEWLRSNISIYSAESSERNTKNMTGKKAFKEITPELLGLHKTSPNEYTSEFVKLLKEAYEI